MAHMPGFGDSAFIILLALLLFGPKKLPVLARQLGKLMADFRRASNEFRFQMEEELRVSEQAERDRKLAAIEAAAAANTPAASLDAPAADQTAATPDFASFGFPDMGAPSTPAEAASSADTPVSAEIPEHSIAPPAETDATQPLPVATAGDLAMMPPSTGLPVPSSSTPYATREAAEPEAQAKSQPEPVAEIVHHG